MFIKPNELYTAIYPFADENTPARQLGSQPSIQVFDKQPEFNRFGEVKWDGNFYTEEDIEQLTAAFAKALELAKAANGDGKCEHKSSEEERPLPANKFSAIFLTWPAQARPSARRF